MQSTLEIVLIFLAASVGVVALARKFYLPPRLGYLLAGIAIGPHAVGLVPNTAATRYLAEFGVVFRMFSIGLEFNLPNLMAMRATVFGLGLAQVVCTTLLGVTGAIVVGIGWQAGIALGGALAMPSTAIEVKLLGERGEMETAHGRDVMGVPLSRVVRRVRTVRESRYGLLRGFSHGAEDTPEDLTGRLHPLPHSVVLPAGAHAVGRSLGDLALDVPGAEVVSIRRRGSVSPAVAETPMLEPADVVVIKGIPESIALAEARLLGG